MQNTKKLSKNVVGVAPQGDPQTNYKTNVNTVGANCVRQKNHNGITLIALIITIIVMIIMVGVTVNVAINGGLIEGAQDARRKTEMNAIYEQLVASIKTNENGKFNVPAIVAVAENSYGNENVIWPDAEGYLIIKGKYGIYKYILKEDEIKIVGIIDEIPEQDDPPVQETGDFEIAVTVDGPTLKIVPMIYTEDEAATIVAQKLVSDDEELTEFFEDVNSFKVFLIRCVNMQLGDEYGFNFEDDEYNNMVSAFNEMGITGFEDPKYAFRLLFENSYNSIEELAWESTQRTLKINGEDVTDKTTWIGNTALYTVEETGTYQIEVGLDGEKGKKTEQVSNSNIQVGTIVAKNYVIDKLGIVNGTEVNYNGTWQVIGTGSKIKLVTTENVADYVDLGQDDENAEGNDRFEKAVWSYQHAIETLDTIASNNTGIANAKSITLKDIEELVPISNANKKLSNSNYGRVWKYYYDTDRVYSTWNDEGSTTDFPAENNSRTNYSSQTFVKFENGGNNNIGNKIVVDSEGKEVILTDDKFSYNFLNDEQEKARLGYLARDLYWVASPAVECSPDSVRFCFRFMEFGSLNYETVVHSTGLGAGYKYGVRAVVSF